MLGQGRRDGGLRGGLWFMMNSSVQDVMVCISLGYVPTKPRRENMYGPTMNGHRIVARSDQTEKMMVVIIPNIYRGTVRS